MSMDVTTDFTHSMSVATRTRYEPRMVDEAPQTIAEVTCTSVPGFDQVGISTRHSNGAVVTGAHMGDLALRLGEIQYGLWEGPCVDALVGCTTATNTIGKELVDERNR